MAKRATGKNTATTRRRTTEKPGVTFQTLGDRLRQPFIDSDYNAAVRLQCVVRDTIGRSVTLNDALNYATAIFHTDRVTAEDVAQFQHMFDEAEGLKREMKEAAERDVREHAGQR